MADKFKTTWFCSALNTYKKDVGLITKKEKEFRSQRFVDFGDYADSLKKTYEELDAEGYEVINVVPISTGQSESCTQRGGGYVGDVGFSITRGAVVVGQKKTTI